MSFASLLWKVAVRKSVRRLVGRSMGKVALGPSGSRCEEVMQRWGSRCSEVTVGIPLCKGCPEKVAVQRSRCNTNKLLLYYSSSCNVRGRYDAEKWGKAAVMRSRSPIAMRRGSCKKITTMGWSQWRTGDVTGNLNGGNVCQYFVGIAEQ